MTLAELQRDFRDWLTTASADASQRLDPRSSFGMTVYQNNYRAQLVSVLEASYPQLHARLGSELFLDAAITHIDRHPPHAWTLDAYGADFEATLRAMLPHNPDVHELAWIEWSLSESFVAPDAAGVSPEQLAQIDWDTARLQFSPSLRHRPAITNAAALWSALQQDVEVPESEMLDAPRALITWRQGYTCQLKQVDTDEYAALQSLHHDNRFASLCDELVARLGEDTGVTRAGELLASWIGAGVVTGVTSG
ncbi:DNA-binding domain-containing protein [Dyella japonica]|uniref:Putative DNA-binding domain-containing protein n=1 Tax=Dyella japonica TaxID=231455 RepID=A0ABV2JWS0_9GAMM